MQRFLELGSRWRLAVSFTHRRLLLRRKKPDRYWVGGYVDSVNVRDDVVKIRSISLDCLAYRQPQRALLHLFPYFPQALMIIF
jgi:hypothetical protein